MPDDLIAMSDREVALSFLKCFCGGNIDGLVHLLDEQLQVDGPLQQFRTRAEYLGGLRADPPEPCDYQVLSVTEGEDDVAVFYDYRIPVGLTVAQWFRFRDHLIVQIRIQTV